MVGYSQEYLYWDKFINSFQNIDFLCYQLHYFFNPFDMTLVSRFLVFDLSVKSDS